MIVIHILVTPKREEIVIFEERLRQVVEEARLLDGCVHYDWYWSPVHERQTFICGEFQSEEAFTQYRTGPVVKKIAEQLLPLLEVRPAFKHFRAVVLEQG